jgi:hypothetical protein
MKPLVFLSFLLGGLCCSQQVFACVQGYVWREATRDDHVCVTAATRAQAWKDNAQTDARRQPGATPYDTCIQGYVWREATQGDHVCVTPATREQARYDNGQAPQRQ